MTAKYRALILDMDGTLTDSLAMVRESLTRLTGEYGVFPTPEQYRMSLGCPSEDLMEALGLPDPIAAADRWVEIMAGMLDRVTLYDGVPQVLAAPIRRGLVTSQTRQELTANMAIHKLEGVFDFTVTVEETPYQKPHPRPLLHCIEKMGLAPGEVLFVGDTPYDYHCALSAGVDFGVACWGADPAESFDRAAYRFRHPTETLSLIEPRSL